jgi:hypothetical protein
MFLSNRSERMSSPESALRRLADPLREVVSIARQERSSVEFFEVRPAERDLTEAENARDAEKRSDKQSLRASRRLLTLWDGLKAAYGEWSAEKVARLIAASAKDWTEPPCPALAATPHARLTDWVKKRASRERIRRRRLGLSAQQQFPG